MSQPASERWTEAEARFLMQTYRRLPAVLERGSGTEVWDTDGKRYLDFVAGIAVNNLGHCPPPVVEAVKRQAEQLIHTSNWYYTTPQIELGRLLVEHSAGDRVFFCNSGAEANEGAIKLARRVGTLRKNGAYEIITADNSFHGRTLATLAATGKPALQQQYDPLPPGFRQVPWNDLDALRAATTARTIAVMLEPVQGEGGVYPPAGGYLQAVRDWCTANELVLILDEIQTGIGRTGALFAYEHFGIEPDIFTLAKGLGAGFVIGAFLAREEFCVFQPGDHGTTFGGNPLACAAGLASLQHILDNRIVEAGRARGEELRRGLERIAAGHADVREVRGMGLLLAVEFTSDVALPVTLAAMERGLLVNPVKPDAVRFMPPLTVSSAEIDEALAIVDDAIRSVLGERVEVPRR